MKKNQLLGHGKVVFFFTVILAFITFFACKQEIQMEEMTTPVREPTSLKVKTAMKWLEDYQKSSNNKSTSHLKKLQPVWKDAIAYRNIVEVPFTIDGKYKMPTIEKGMTRLGRQRLVIYNNGKGMTNAYVASYMPSLNFMGKIKNINALNLKYQKFDGIVRLYTLNKEYLRSTHYKNGVLETRSLVGNAKNRLNTRGEGCYEEGEDPETEWACWEENGEWTCRESVVIKPECPPGDPCDGPYPPSNCPGGDPCDGPNPPPNCSVNDDPCNSPFPPPYCDGGGDPCMSAFPPPNCGSDGDNGNGDTDPCNSANPPDDCIKCKCSNFSKTKSGIGKVTFSEPGITLAELSHTVVFSVTDCSSPTYSVNTTPNVSNPWGAVILPIGTPVGFEYQSYRVKFNDPQCGHKVNWEIMGGYECKIDKKVNINGFEVELKTHQTQYYDDITRIVILD